MVHLKIRYAIWIVHLYLMNEIFASNIVIQRSYLFTLRFYLRYFIKAKIQNVRRNNEIKYRDLGPIISLRKMGLFALLFWLFDFSRVFQYILLCILCVQHVLRHVKIYKYVLSTSHVCTDFPLILPRLGENSETLYDHQPPLVALLNRVLQL